MAAPSPLATPASPTAGGTDSLQRDSSHAKAAVQAGVPRPPIPAPSSPSGATRTVVRPPQLAATAQTKPAVRPTASDAAAPIAPNVNIGAIAIPTGTVDLRIAPPDLLLSLREQLSAGAKQVDDGDYAAARRGFRVLQTRTDSALETYRMSPTLTKLRRDVEEADARARDACAAENELLRRRGGHEKPCA